jgi:DNA glycosylase AlkZ-like
MRSFGVEERRARLVVRHHLAPDERASTVVDAVRSLVALHSTDPASVFLSLQARVRSVTPPSIEDALYEERVLLRMLGMRRTMFVVPTELAPIVQAACTAAIAERQRALYAQMVAGAGVGDAAFLAELGEETAAALAVRKQATGAQLSIDVPRLRTPIKVAEGKSYGREQNLTTWVLFQLAADGRIVRGRPRGTWISSQYHWSPIEEWLPGGLEPLPVEQARAELVRSWLRAYGPGTVKDVQWWTGLGATQVKAALRTLGAVEVDLGGATGAILPGDEAPTPPPEGVALLPALDPTPMGWAQRDWYIEPAHMPMLFDRSGNIGPTVWVHGRVVGGWAQRANGDVVYRLLEDVDAEATREVAQQAGRLTEWIGPVRVTPRFRTPLERELVA